VQTNTQQINAQQKSIHGLHKADHPEVTEVPAGVDGLPKRVGLCDIENWHKDNYSELVAANNSKS